MLGFAVPLSYFLACFLLSAAIVRAFPKSRIGIRLRRHLFLAGLLPALVLIELSAVLSVFFGIMLQGVRSSFELLSGHKLMNARSAYFGYGGSGRRRRGRS
ncbi:hypothetical protein [Qipengyuania gaetbuli]|uniref:hypothetical protein n=1 Tax=Qipengyuania gaetbuli TaxID=266952 RepID=UPI001CFF0133|nr:hypothetical protein [Qipengyuania gaetbuli]